MIYTQKGINYFKRFYKITMLCVLISLFACSQTKQEENSTQVEKKQVLRIKNYGPKTSKAGSGFNIQPGDSSAIWFKTEGLDNKSIVVIWGERKLNTFTCLDKQLVTAEVPDELFSSPGTYKIYASSKKIVGKRSR